MRFNKLPANVLLGAAVFLSASNVTGLTELSDSSLSEVKGAGLAFAFDDFRFQMAPTSYFEQMGAVPDPNITFRRGNYRWIGTAITAGPDYDNGQLFHFSDYGDGTHGSTPTGGCTISISALDCPIARGPVTGYADLNNPFLLRVREYDAVGRTAIGGDWITGEGNTVAELIGPTNSEDFRWAFWGEVETTSDDGLTQLGLLQNQEIIIGSPTSRFRPGGGDGAANIAGPVFRMFRNQTDQSLGMIYHHRLSGDFRLSVAKTSDDNGFGVPTFAAEEGMYFTNVNAYLPLGQMHYQSLILNDSPSQDGNFEVELTVLPNDPEVFHDFYGLGNNLANFDEGYQRTGRPDRYYETHGYVRWGDKFMDNGGVSKVRFSGVDPDGATRIVNQANFPTSTCQTPYGPGVNGDDSGPCGSYSGATVGNVVFGQASRTDILKEGGMVFVSRDASSTWKVVNNTSRAPNENLQMLWVTWNGSQVELQRDSRYSNYNPTLNVNAINLGSSRVEGMQIQHLKMTTLGAANP